VPEGGGGEKKKEERGEGVEMFWTYSGLPDGRRKEEGGKKGGEKGRVGTAR